MESLWMQTAPRIPADDGEPPSGSEVVIAGAGLTGLSLARMLADAGLRVTVLEARSVGAVTTGNTTGTWFCAVETRTERDACPPSPSATVKVTVAL